MNCAVEYEIKTVNEALALFELFSSRESINWIFRGQCNSEWKLASGFDRVHYSESTSKIVYSMFENDPGFFLNSEREGIQRFKKLCGVNYKYDVEYLALMQHYGATTRLLDFTTSLLVALFFAFENCSSKSSAVWAISLNDINRRYLEKDVREDVGEEVQEIEYDELCRIYCLGSNGFIKRYLDMTVEIFSDINRVKSRTDMGVIPIITLGNNKRIIRQRGLFLFPLTFSSFLKNLSGTLDLGYHEDTKDISYCLCDNINDILNNPCIKLVFDKSISKDFKKMFPLFNLSLHDIYPDIEGLSKSINLYEIMPKSII